MFIFLFEWAWEYWAIIFFLRLITWTLYTGNNPDQHRWFMDKKKEERRWNSSLTKKTRADYPKGHFYIFKMVFVKTRSRDIFSEIIVFFVKTTPLKSHVKHIIFLTYHKLFTVAKWKLLSILFFEMTNVNNYSSRLKLCHFSEICLF